MSDDETRVLELTKILTDADGNLRPIERIDFEPLGSQVRWSIWSEGRRLQSITGQACDVQGLLQATQAFLAVALGDPRALLPSPAAAAAPGAHGGSGDAAGGDAAGGDSRTTIARGDEDAGFQSLVVGIWRHEVERARKQAERRGTDLCAYMGTAVMDRVRRDEEREQS